MATTTNPSNGANDRDAEIFGRGGADDLQAILSVSNTEADEAIHAVADNADAIFTWDYEKGARPPLEKLYEKAKNAMWNGTTDLPWEIEVDQEEFASQMVEMGVALGPNSPVDLSGTVFSNWGPKEFTDLAIQNQNWSLSQFMHGEQGALVCTAKIVETVPWIDAKYYAATQVMDEARHVEVFARYLDEKLCGHYPINAHLRMLLDDIISDSRWDMTYLGMQVMVEGLALAAFGMARQTTPDPLLKQLLRYVMSDEARHVAFGVLSLKEFYAELTDAEMLERQEFAFEAAVRMRDRFLQQEVWERMGIDTKDAFKVFDLTAEEKNADPFQQLLFSKIVPNCKKLGLLDANDGWLRKRFDTLGVSQFESWADTGEEYEMLDEVTKDRDAAEAETA
ncbi:MAG: ferritin-like domain-containing protein [Iamia sp.]